MGKFRVLFVCGGNSSRSQMAEAFLRSLAGDSASVSSAGVTAEGLHPLAVQVMEEVGIDLSSYTSKSVPELKPKTFDLVITLCEPAREYCRAPGHGPSEKNPVLAGVPLQLDWPIPDPAEVEGTRDENLAAFRTARDKIRGRVETLVSDGYLAAIAEGRERLDKILDSLEDAVLIHDEKRRIYLFNRAAERITGYSREDVVGKDCHQVFSPTGLCGSQCQFIDEPPGSTGRQERDVRFVTRDGEDRLLKMAITPMDVGAGRPGQVIARMRDVTELTELRGELKRKHSFRGMVGISRAMQEVFGTIREVSISDYPVVIVGESGAGKELVARAIHNESRRKGGPFVPINCGALPDHILESELFGHVRGAFTGAIRDRKGRFELADRGSLFLDEVGELSPAFQVKLLRVLQEKRFDRVGGERPVSVDVRIISATNRELRELMKEGSFREDLYYRLSVVPISLPPLRERLDDIPLLVKQILTDIRKESVRAIERVAGETMDLLMSYGWPGNVRELINALRFASVRCTEDEILPHHLPTEVRQSSGPVPPRDPALQPLAVSTNIRRHPKDRLTLEAVETALVDAKGNKVRAAKLLGVGRATLYRFLDRNLLSKKNVNRQASGSGASSAGPG